ncbi:MAG: hypothetical protein IJT73_02240 [Selenomonadaceae bacterium]|nr:hypothetical protein [Selenomonadaceae bacterium]
MKKSRREFIEAMVEKYKHYCRTEESYAVLFVKKYLRAAEDKWIDIVDFEVGRYNNAHELEFQSVVCELFPKNLKPKYPPKKMFEAEADYTLACRAITWQTAHKDIEEQREKNIQGSKYVLRGIRVKIANPNYTGEYFIKDAPEEIKALAKNLNDKTDPLWDIAIKYINNEKEYFYEYKLISVKRLPN